MVALPELTECPHCTCDDKSQLEVIKEDKISQRYLCNNCAKEFVRLKEFNHGKEVK